MGTSSFPKTSRLLNANEYQAVFNQSSFKVSCRHFLILAIPNNDSVSRLGIVVAKKNVAKAVQRNRIKRQIREWFRHQDFENSIDLIVLVRRDADRLLNSQLADKLRELGSDLNKKSGTQRGQTN